VFYFDPKAKSRKEAEWTAAAIASLGAGHPFRASVFSVVWHHLLIKVRSALLKPSTKG